MEAKHNKSTEALKISGDWSQQVDDLKEKFPQLTDSDLKFERGIEDDLIKKWNCAFTKKGKK